MKTLETVLGSFEPDIAVDIVGDHSLIATVVSSRFDGLDEADRQEAVWKHLRENLDESELQNIEFILINTPDEVGTENTVSRSTRQKV